MSDDLKSLVKNSSILIVVLILTYFLSYNFGVLYNKFIYSGSTFVDLTGVVGIPLSYIFFLILLFIAFGGRKKYWWIGVLLIPAIVFEVYFDFSHLYFPIVVGFAGWFLGFSLRKIINRVQSFQ